MASHASIIQICNYHKILIHFFIFVLSCNAQTTPFTLPPCWRKIPQKTYYGVDNVYETTLGTCMEKCVQTYNCQMINYKDGAEWPCWIYDDLVIENNFKYYATYDIYRLDGDCIIGPCWKKHANVRFLGLTRKHNEKTLIACAETCLQTRASCNQIAFEHSKERPCYVDEIHMRMIWTEDDSEQGIDSYQMDWDCWDRSNTMKPTTTKKPKIELPKCWEEFENRKYMDLSTNTYETTLPTCLENCRKTRNCIAISFKRDNKWPCFMTTESVELRLSEEDALYDSYVVDAECIITPLPVCWDKYDNIKFKNLINYKNQNSLITCMEICLTNFSGCAMLTFLRGKNDPCYLSLQSNMTHPPVASGDYMISYRLDEDCLRRSRAVTETTTTTTTTKRTTTTTTTSTSTTPEIGPITRIDTSPEIDIPTSTGIDGRDPDTKTDPDTETDPDKETDPDIITGPDTEIYEDYGNDSYQGTDNGTVIDDSTNLFMTLLPFIIIICIIITVAMGSIIFKRKPAG